MLEAADVAYVKEIETTVREDDDFPRSACASDSPGQGCKGHDLVSGGRRRHESFFPRPNNKRNTLNGALIALGTLDINVCSGSASTRGALTGPSTSK